MLLYMSQRILKCDWDYCWVKCSRGFLIFFFGPRKKLFCYYSLRLLIESFCMLSLFAYKLRREEIKNASIQLKNSIAGTENAFFKSPNAKFSSIFHLGSWDILHSWLMKWMCKRFDFSFKFAKCPVKIISVLESSARWNRLLAVASFISSCFHCCLWFQASFYSRDVFCLILGSWPSYHSVLPLASLQTQQLRMLSPY